MMHNQDINRVSGSLVVVLPLSINRLHTGQSPEHLYEFLSSFKLKYSNEEVDYIFIYTNGLYFNSPLPSHDLRVKTIAKMLSHKEALLGLFRNDKNIVKKSLHFLPWDYVMLNSEFFREYLTLLKKRYLTDANFRQILTLDLRGREITNINFDFLIEEILTTYFVRQMKVDLPCFFAKYNSPRLIAYHGDFIAGDVYIHQQKILPLYTSEHLYSHSVYDVDKKKLFDYNEINLNTLLENFDIKNYTKQNEVTLE